MGRVRVFRMLTTCLAAAAALTLAPVAAGVARGDQPPSAPAETTTTTVDTSGAWTSSTGGTALVECPYSTYATIAGAAWIWANLGQEACPPGTVPGATVTLSTTFTVPGDPQGATLELAADNGATVLINGSKVADLAADGTAGTFDTVHTYAIAGGFLSGTNTISITGTNLDAGGYNPAGVVASLTVSSTLTSTSQCKDGGWAQWTDPAFTNEGDCVSYVVSHGNDPVNG